MEYDDYFSPVNENHLDIPSRKQMLNVLEETKGLDKGYSKISRPSNRTDVKNKQNKIEIYTSGDIGSNIRDAETGVYYADKVGSADEYLFFKVVIATGECNSKNGSSTLFYLSPNHYMSHMNCDVDSKTITQWEEKKNNRLKEKEKTKRAKNAHINVN
jgi:hypothetical protein